MPTAAPAADAPRLLNRPWRCKWAVLPAMFAVALLAYWPAVRGAFIGDDVIYLPHGQITQSPHGWYRAWTATGTQDYYPITYSLWWLMWRAWGATTWPYHLVNIALHAASAWLIWRTLRAIGARAALAAACLWLLHPLNVAGVAWIAELKDTLSMLFFLAALRCYVEATGSAAPSPPPPAGWAPPTRTSDGAPPQDVILSAGSTQPQSKDLAPPGAAAPPRPSLWYTASIALFAAALLSKTAVVAGPIVLLLYEAWRRKLDRRALLRSVPFFALSLTLGLVTVAYQTRNAIAGNAIRADGLPGRIAGAAVALWFYLAKTLCPVHLSYIYPKWPTTTLPAWIALAALVLATVVIAANFRTWGRHAALALGYFVLMLLPVLGLRDISFHLYTWVADQWAYPATIGVVALVTAAAATLTDRLPRPVPILLTTAVAMLLGAMTFTRAAVWQNGEALWRDTVAKVPTAWSAWNSLAGELLTKGDLTEAETDARRSLSLNPGNGDAYLTLGAILQAEGDFPAAEQTYRRGAAAVPRDADIKYNLGLLLARRGDLPAAEAAYRAAIAANPRHPSAYANLGRVLERQGRTDEAEQAYRQDLALDPRSVAGRTNLANLLLNQNRLTEAASLLQDLPDVPNAVNTLGVIRARQGRPDDAERLFRRAIALKDDFPEAHSNLAALLASRGDAAAARREFQRALALRPGLEQAVHGLENLNQ